MKNVNILFSLIAAVLLTGCAGPEVRLKKVSPEVSVAGWKHDMRTVSKLASSIKAEDLSPERLRGYSDETLNAVYEALTKISFYLPDEESYALRQEKAFDEKLRRGKVAGDDAERMYNAFIMSGLFEKAAAVGLKFPGDSLPEVPEIIPGDSARSAGWLAYNVSAEGKKAELLALPSGGPRMVMVMRPGCEFAEMAADAIFSDPELGPAFRSNGFMLTRKFDPAGVEAVKKRSDFDAVYIARKSADFPWFSLLRISPTFYFIKDRKILDEFSGWDNDEGGKYAKERIRKGLAAIGLITETGASPAASSR